MGLRTGGRRTKSLKNRVKSSKIELRFREVRPQSRPSCTAVLQALIGRKFTTQKLENPGKSAFSGAFLCLNGLIWFDQIWQNESRFHPIFSGPQVVNWLKRGQKEGEVVPKVVNREPIFGVLFSPPSPRFLAVAVWHSLS